MRSLLARIGNRLSPARRELRRQRSSPRGIATRSWLIAPEFETVDGGSFAAQYEQIFGREEFLIPAGDPTPRIIDCGANVGTFTVFCARRFPGSRIVAFEPDPRVFAVLQRNVSRCCPASSIELVNAAVADRETGAIRFRADGCDAGRLTGDASSGATIEVRAVRLRDYLAEPCAMLKMDIEGAESDVLRDCRDMLAATARIFVEYHSFADRPQDLDEVLTILKDAGFRCYIHSGKVPSRPFLDRPCFLGMDMQLDIWGVREGTGG